MNIPNLKYGNCHIFCLLFKLMNWSKSKWKVRIVRANNKTRLSLHIIYDGQYRILYRSRPKGNMTSYFFKGRPQIIPLNRINKK